MTITTPEEPWLSRSFLKDTKLRTVERYFRRERRRGPLIQHLAAAPSSSSEPPLVARIIPDAIAWRKYLRLIQVIVKEYHDADTGKSPSPPLFQWILTESAVELMDHRNQTLHETPTPQERNLLQRLVQQHGLAVVVTYPDLSIRQECDDEWDMLDMGDMDVEERSRHAQIRAATNLMTMNAATNETTTTATPFWLLVDTLDGVYSLDENDNDADVQYVTMQEVVDRMVSHSSSDQVERLNELLRICQQEYLQRNVTSSLQSPTGDGTDRNGNERNELSIRKGLQTGQLFRGRLNVSKENTREAYVTVTTSGKGSQTLFVDGTNINRAFHQDMVIIEPLPESQWGRPVGRRRLVHHSGNDNDDLDIKSSSTKEVTPDDTPFPPVPSGRVVAIDQVGRRVFVATLIDTPNNDESAVLVVPMDMRIPKIRVKTRAWRRWQGQRLKVEIVSWDATSLYPSGHCLDVMGPIGDIEVEVKALLIENQVELEPFSTSALACLPIEGSAWTVTDDHVQAGDRRDLRFSRHVFSVDPPGCQDIDDSMHAEILPNGDIEVGVHIADVTHFVEHNSQLDKEAQVRGTTFYLVDRRFDMLPGLLSSNLCSLHGGVDRLAVSAIWTLSSTMQEVKSTWFGRTVIRNSAAMTYDQADNILHDKPPDDPRKPLPPPLTAGSPVDERLIGRLKKDLTVLTQLARMRRKDREVFGGAVDLSEKESGSELKFTLENGKPIKVIPKQDKEIHHTIAELMIMANTDVAKLIHKSFPDSALLRTHRRVEESRLEELRTAMESTGVKLTGTDGASLAKSLQAAQQKARSTNQPFQSLLLNMATRAMTEAQYVCTGDVEEAGALSHYGLGLNEYTHFTSPIRRYCDVIVHKQLLAALAISDGQSAPTSPPRRMHLAPLESLPQSEEISVLAGQGLAGSSGEGGDGDELVDELIQGATALVLTSDDQTSAMLPENQHALLANKPYSQTQVSSISEGLNLHNRLAKHSSYECQSLFLSLYFKDHIEYAQAVVTNLRENGIVVYVPKYDFKGPIYLRDTNGDVQMDPAFLGLQRDFGFAPTLGFANISNYRRLPTAVCTMADGEDERFEVTVAGSPVRFVVRAFDVVQVAISCDNWDVRARVPAPRIHLCAATTTVASTGADDPSEFQGESVMLSLGHLSTRTESQANVGPESSLYEALRSMRRKVHIQNKVHSSDNTIAILRTEAIKGRVVFGDFTNPNTRSAAQAAAQLAAATEASERRNNLLESASRRSEFDTSRSIERNVTSRQQRLASDKRNARRSKAS